MSQPGEELRAREQELSDEDPGVRRQAANELARLGAAHPELAPAALTALQRGLNDRLNPVRETCAQAMGLIGPLAVPALTAALEHPDWGVRQCAARALGRLGAHARPALPTLERLARPPFFGIFQHPYRRLVREQAAYSVREIQSS